MQKSDTHSYIRTRTGEKRAKSVDGAPKWRLSPLTASGKKESREKGGKKEAMLLTSFYCAVCYCTLLQSGHKTHKTKAIMLLCRVESENTI